MSRVTSVDPIRTRASSCAAPGKADGQQSSRGSRSVVDQHEDGQASFKVFAPHAAHVEIVGSFTGWHDRPTPMKRGDDGWWRTTVTLDPGDHEFQYLIDHREWRADYAAGGLKLNEFGTWVSLLTVHASPPRIRLHPAVHAHAA